MENFEIILNNFSKSKVDKFIASEILHSKNKIRDSNFFDNFNKKSLPIENISSLSKLLDPIGSGYISFLTFMFGIPLENTVITFSFDKKYGDIVINFEMKTFFGKKIPEIGEICVKIIKTALQFKTKYLVPVILIGFEPADNDDLCILHLGAEDINLIKATKLLTDKVITFNK